MDKKESCSTGFSACGGSRKRHSTIPPQCDPRGAFLSYKNEVSYTIGIAAQSSNLRTERQFLIQFNFPSFSGYIVCAEAILYFCVSDATGKRNTLRLLLRQRRGARKRRMQSVDRRDRLPDYRTFRASPFWKMRRIRFASRIRTVHTSFR